MHVEIGLDHRILAGRLDRRSAGFPLSGYLELHSNLAPFARLSFPESVDRKVHYNPVEPRAERRIAPECPERVVHPDKRLLCDVFSLLMVADDSIGNIIGLLHVALDEETERFAASFLRIENQSPLVIGWR